MEKVSITAWELKKYWKSSCTKNTKLSETNVVFNWLLPEVYPSQPLTQLPHITVPFIWTTQCQKAYDLPKEALMESPFLVYPDPNGPYILFTNAFKYIRSAFLTQAHTASIDDKVINHQHSYLCQQFYFKAAN